MDLMEKLTILADAAKYDAACTSSGSDRPGGTGIGHTVRGGCCHTFSADGRCVTLLKVLMSNHCVYDCKYCVSRISNDIPRAAFTPDELAELTIQFYRRNYIEGLFLSSGVLKSPDHTMELMIRALQKLRYEYRFWGYVHAKSIPGASDEAVMALGRLADRLSVNIELPSEASLQKLAPQKTKAALFAPMRRIAAETTRSKLLLAEKKAATSKPDLILSRRSRPDNRDFFAPAGQATQMIIGASPESDFQILKLTSALYEKFRLKRVFFSAYVPAVRDSLLPDIPRPPLLREHRLYQADWLLRQYRFSVSEILNEENPNFNPFLDPKCNWAINNMHLFPIDVNTAGEDMLLRVPGIGPVSARRIIQARKHSKLDTAGLKRLGVVLKRARYFIACHDCPLGLSAAKERVLAELVDPKSFALGVEQLTLFGEKIAVDSSRGIEEATKEAVRCLSLAL